MQHKDLITDIQSDPSHFNSCFDSHINALNKQFPNQDMGWLYYWASRLSLLGDADEISIRFSDMDNIEESTEINITFNPDYGS